jgi:hypothetical protein
VKKRPKISAELGEFLESGLSIVLATRDSALRPDGAVAWAARVEEAGARLTVFLHEAAARAMLANLEQHPEIAIDFDRPTTHRACQVKGRHVGTRVASEAEKDVVFAQIESFAADLEVLGYPRTLSSSWTVWPCHALEVTVEQIFEQTPGPGSGEPLP